MARPVYATEEKFAELSVAASSFSGLPAGTIGKHLASASRLADVYLSSRYTLPLTAWDDDLGQVVCDISAWTLLKRRGFNPEAPGDIAVRQGYEDAVALLKTVAGGKGGFQVTDSSAGAQPGVPRAPAVYSGSQRGFSARDEDDLGDPPGDFVGD